MIANYHTHTTRCHHASGKEEDFVLRAIEITMEAPAHWYGVRFESALGYLMELLEN